MAVLTIVTFNLRCNAGCDGINMFINRRGNILAKIDEVMPDVIGFQEMTAAMHDFLVRHLPEYAFVGRARTDDLSSEHVDIAYRRDRLELWGLDYFWLSPTPYIPGSRYPDQSECPRITTVALLHHRDFTKPFRVYNTHLDHVGPEARRLGMRQILDRITEDNHKQDFPFFITGDLNAEPSENTIADALAYGDYPVRELTEKLDVTFHSWGKENIKIDYIFADKRIVTAENYKITRWTDENNGIYLSDHYPVMCEIEF